MKEVVKKILIDARSMRRGKNGPSTYAINMLLSLANIDSTNKYTIIVNSGYSDLIKQDNFKLITTEIEPYRIKEHWAIRRLLNGEEFDIFHSLQYIPPFGLKYPLIMTIYDTMHMDKGFWEGSLLRLFAGKYARILSRKSIKKTKSVITISSYSAMQISKTFKFPIERIFPIHLGVDSSFANRDHKSDSKYSMEKWNIPGPYILTISNMRPYKNVERLIYAFSDQAKYITGQNLIVDGGWTAV